MTPERRAPIVWILSGAVLVYAAVALSVGRWWISGAGALVGAAALSALQLPVALRAWPRISARMRGS